MRILAVNWLDPENPEAGGAEMHLFEILKRLVQRGHDITLVCSGFAHSAQRTTIEGVEVRRYGDRHTFALRGRGAVRRALRAGSYDLVLEDINKLPLYLPTLTDLPFYVIVPHLFGTTVFREASPPVGALVWLSERPVPHIYRRAAFHAISDSTKQDLVVRGVPAQQIRVIPPGVDTVWYCPDPAVPRAPEPTFLYVGRLKRYKGIDTAIRALAAARERGANSQLVIAGTGDDRPRLERIARRLGLERIVRFVGFVDEAEKRRLIRNAWAVVLPSAKEGWGLTNVEAAACGTPAVAADRPGLRETVQDGRTGFLVPFGEPDRWADALTRLASNAALVASYGTAARAFAQSLSWDATADATEAHLEQTLARAQGRKE